MNGRHILHLTVLLTTVAVGGTAAAAECGPITGLKTKQLKLYGENGSGPPKNVHVADPAAIEVHGCSDDKRWVHVTIDGSNGWVKRFHVRMERIVTNKCAAAPHDSKGVRGAGECQ